MSQQPRRMMGFETNQDEKIPVTVRDWNAKNYALWRAKTALEIVERAARDIVRTCVHVDGCPGQHSDSEPCVYRRPAGGGISATCRDREMRMSALVIIGAATQLAPPNARRPAGEYFAPSRELYSETITELGILQLENDALRAALAAAGLDVPPPIERPVAQLAAPEAVPELPAAVEPSEPIAPPFPESPPEPHPDLGPPEPTASVQETPQ